VSRDRLLGLLWPERDERTARHLLADSLYVLRCALGDRAITASGEALRLSARDVWTDVVEFQRAVADARWSEALDLYRGDFLDGFFLRNAAEFDQWALAERSRLRAQATRAAAALSTGLAAAGRLQDALATSERALEIAPHDETIVRDIVRQLIAAHNMARRQSAARSSSGSRASSVCHLRPRRCDC
jgi:DNA-binding SARP family transcriptional activator